MSSRLRIWILETSAGGFIRGDASAWKWEMYSLINTACTGADLSTEQNWLERWRRQGRKTKFMHNCLNFFATKPFIEVSVTSLCVPN